VLVSLCYVSLRWLLEFVALSARSKEFQKLEIIVLRHELAILRRTTRRPAISAVDRVLLAVASRLLPRVRWRSFIVTPATLLRWHRRLVACASNAGRSSAITERRSRSHVLDKMSAACSGAYWCARLARAPVRFEMPVVRQYVNVRLTD
jgi:hypothetical protein